MSTFHCLLLWLDAHINRTLPSLTYWSNGAVLFLQSTHLQKWWFPTGCRWWRPVWWFEFWCRPSRSSPLWRRSPPPWHRRYLAQSEPSWCSCTGHLCPHHGFQSAARTGGTFSPLPRARRTTVYMLITCVTRENETKKDVGSGLPKHDCLLGESFMRCGQVQDAVRL